MARLGKQGVEEEPIITSADEEPARKRALDEFSRARAEAINAYAQLEQSLATLFNELLGAHPTKVLRGL
jgi:hypothetical protein